MRDRLNEESRNRTSAVGRLPSAAASSEFWMSSRTTAAGRRSAKPEIPAGVNPVCVPGPKRSGYRRSVIVLLPSGVGTDSRESVQGRVDVVLRGVPTETDTNGSRGVPRREAKRKEHP